MARPSLLIASMCLIALGLSACKRTSDETPQTGAPRVEAVAGADGLCIPTLEADRIEAQEHPSDPDVLKILRHYGVCVGDSQKAKELAQRWARNGSPAAIYDLAIHNLNTSTDLDQVVPLLERGAAMGYQPAAEQLDLMIAYTAVAHAFGIRRILPKVKVEVPTRLQNVTASQVHQLCQSEDSLDETFCQLAVSRVMTETGSCRGRSSGISIRQSHRRIAELPPSGGQTPLDYVSSSVKACDTTE